MFVRMKHEWLPYALKNAPRYTSYPTAVQFSPAVDERQARDWARHVDPDAPISVYTHVPFCEKLCWYCGCHTTIPNGYDRIGRFFKTLLGEIDLWKSAMGHHGGAGHVHFGGGTPNALNSEHMLALLEALHQGFNIREDAEIAAELDPRTLGLDMVRALAAGGLTRASLGVQDFNETVQRAVNRVQPYDQVAEAVTRLRNWGVSGLSFDLLYGLPHQDANTVRETAKLAASLSPDRVSAFGYAHVPWFAKHQKAIDEAALPGVEARFDLFHIIAETLADEGYLAIGLDHFARADDPLAIAHKEGRLSRNFQGYTDDPCDTLVALGPSGISEFSDGYFQNTKNIRDWHQAIDAGRLAVERGVGVSSDDKLRRAVIERIMCDMVVDVGAVCEAHGYDTDELDACFALLAPLEADGLCHISGRTVTAPEDARIFLRSVAQAFDAYAAPVDAPARHARAV